MMSDAVLVAVIFLPSAFVFGPLISRNVHKV